MARRRVTVGTVVGPGRAGLPGGKMVATPAPVLKPYVPPPLPAGSFDPALDAQRRAATRGLGDLEQDIQTAGVRDTVDYGLGRESIQRAQGRGNSDIDAQLAMMQRGFQRLAGQQRQSIHAAGLGEGARLQAAARRMANETVARQPLDVARTRLNEDAALQMGQLALELAPPGTEGGPLGGRRFQDRGTQLSRAQREDVSFGLDIDAQKSFQAAQSGYDPPPTPQERAAAHRARQRSAARRALLTARRGR